MSKDKDKPVVITRRDYFAAAALQGLLANSFSDGINQPLSLANSQEMASMARDQADHLIKALNAEVKHTPVVRIEKGD